MCKYLIRMHLHIVVQVSLSRHFERETTELSMNNVLGKLRWIPLPHLYFQH